MKKRMSIKNITGEVFPNKLIKKSLKIKKKSGN